MESDMAECTGADVDVKSQDLSVATCPAEVPSLCTTDDFDFIVLDDEEDVVADMTNLASAPISSDEVNTEVEGNTDIVEQTTEEVPLEESVSQAETLTVLAEEEAVSHADTLTAQAETAVHEEILTTLADIGDSLMVVDEWEDEEILKEAERKREELEDNANIDEKNILTMSSLSNIEYNIGREERLVNVYPLSMSDVNHPEYLKLGTISTCIDIKLHFLRPKDDDTTWKGFATIHFMSREDAASVAEDLKQIGSHIITKIAVKPEDSAKDAEKWEKSEKIQQKLSAATMLHVKNVPPGTVVSQLKKFFPEAKYIVIHFPRTSSSSSSSRRSSTGDPPALPTEGVAYVLFRSAESCKESADAYFKVRPEVNGRKLKVYAYREPAKQIPACFLSLSERRTVLLTEERLAAVLEKAKVDDPDAKPPSSVEREHRACGSVLERDKRTRKYLNLLSPSLEELNTMERLPVLTEEETKQLMKRVHISDRDRSRDRSRSRDRDRQHRGSDRSQQSDRHRSVRDGSRERDRSRDRRHGDKDESSRRKRTNDERSSASRTKDTAASSNNTKSANTAAAVSVSSSGVKSASSNGGVHTSNGVGVGGSDPTEDNELILESPQVSVTTPDVLADNDDEHSGAKKLRLDSDANDVGDATNDDQMVDPDSVDNLNTGDICEEVAEQAAAV